MGHVLTDKLVDKGMIELVRDINKAAQVPVLLVGEELLPQKLEQYERVHNRVLEWVLAQPCDLADARAQANLLLNWPALPAYTDTLALALLHRLKRESPSFRFRTHAAGLVDNLFGEPAVGAPAQVHERTVCLERAARVQRRAQAARPA